MTITGTIDQVFPRFYYREGKKINYYEVLVSYNFYNGVNQILLLAKDFDKRDIHNKEQLFVFEFDIATKYIDNRLTTDFYLQSYKKINPTQGASLIVIRTYFEKDSFELLVSYNFYNGVNQILLLAKDFDKRDIHNKEQLFVFEFDIATKYIDNRLTTDFYLQSYKKINPTQGASLIVIRTYFEKDSFEV